MRLALAIAVLTALAGCQSGDPVDERGTDPVESAADLPSSQASPPTALASSCETGTTEHADVDGDGRLDGVEGRFVEADEHFAELIVCLASGRVLATPAQGNLDILWPVDLNGDGREEILDGGTSASSSGSVIHTWFDDDLVVVADPDGRDFWLSSGLMHRPDDAPEDWEGWEAWGCHEEDGRRLVVTIVGEQRAGVVTVHVDTWLLVGPSMRLVGQASHRAEPGVTVEAAVQQASPGDC